MGTGPQGNMVAPFAMRITITVPTSFNAKCFSLQILFLPLHPLQAEIATQIQLVTVYVSLIHLHLGGIH